MLVAVRVSTIGSVDVGVAVTFVGVAGVAAGLATGVLLARRRPRSRSVPAPTLTAVEAAIRPRARPRLAAGALEVLHIGALVVDRQDAVVLCNAAGQGMGLVRGNQLALAELCTLAGDARRHGSAREAEVRLLHGWLPRDPVAVCARAIPIGRSGHIALLVEDVTEQRRLADMRRDFVANVSHELKTPVGALSLLAEALSHACDDPDAVGRFADRVRHESARLARLVQELIELSRLEADDPLPEPTCVPVGQVVSEAVDRTRLAGNARHIAVAVTGDTAASVLGNREQLVTAVVNLIDNAIQYSPERTQVDVAVRRQAGDTDHLATVEIIVTDQGIGIAEADLDRVFERFYRADPARSRATGGTGLGLAIVKHVAANHGGRVSVTSRARHGSTFTLTLPVTPTPAGEAAR